MVQAKYDVTNHGAADPRLETEIRADVDAGIGTVERFFGGSYRKPFQVEVFANRASLDEVFKAKWQAPPTEKWMVAAGVADELFLLSPKAWKTEASGHNGDDPQEVRRIVTHELVHVYHGQHNPKPTFDGMDEMAWFIEGLATYVSGQLDGRQLSARQAIQAGKEPKRLADAWTGPYRYGVSGAIVRYIDSRYGRKKLIALLSLTSSAAALKALGVDEATLLRDWKKAESKNK